MTLKALDAASHLPLPPRKQERLWEYFVSEVLPLPCLAFPLPSSPDIRPRVTAWCLAVETNKQNLRSNKAFVTRHAVESGRARIPSLLEVFLRPSVRGRLSYPFCFDLSVWYMWRDTIYGDVYELLTRVTDGRDWTFSSALAYHRRAFSSMVM